MQQILADLAAEHADLDHLLAEAGSDEWDLPTPAEGWTIRDQISHLAFFDERAAQAATDQQTFLQETNRALADLTSFTNAPLDRGRGMEPAGVLAWWRSARSSLLDALGRHEAQDRLPWYGPPMSARSFATARIMETWAHGQDIADALGAARTPTDRLRHICHLGVTTFAWSYLNRGRTPPETRVRVELVAPSGERWDWNEPSENVVRGSAEDFCLVVTQRRNLADTNLETVGTVAAEWMAIAQCFAGPPTDGPGPS